MTAKRGDRRKATKPPADETSGPSISTGAKGQADARQPGGLGRSREWGFLAGSGSIVVAALLLRIYHLGTHELWVDEVFSFYMATTPDVVGGLLLRSTPPLYYLLLSGWVFLAGQSEAAVRLLSAIAGTFFVAAVIWAGREIIDARVGLWSGAIAAVAPIHIYYSQEARAYALFTLAMVLSYTTLWRAVQTNTWRWWALASACAVLAAYTHYFAILGLLPGAFLVLVWLERPSWRRCGTAMFVSGLLVLPWILWSFVLTPRSFAGTWWMQRVWENTPPLLAIPVTLEVFGLGPQAGFPLWMKQFNTLVFPASLRLLGLAILVLLGIWVAVPWGDQHVGVPELGRRKAWLALLLGFPLAVLWAVSFYKPYYMAGRYDLVAFPAFPLLLGLALFKLQRGNPAGSVLAPIVAFLLLIPVGVKLLRYYQAPSVGDAQVTATILHTTVGNGDVVVFTGDRGLPVLYYLSRFGYRWQEGYCHNAGAGRRFGCRMYPREMEKRPAAYDPGWILSVPDAVREAVQEYLRQLPPSEGELWVAFARGSFSQGRLTLPIVDDLLARELERLNLKPLPVSGVPGVFRFRRS